MLQNGPFKSHMLLASVDKVQVTSERMLKNETSLLDEREDGNAPGR